MSDSIADDILRSGYERWLRLEEEKAAVSDDIKELMAELKGHGFTPKAVRESFRRVRNADNADQQEHDAIVDLYVASLTRARPAPAHEKTLNNSRSYAEEKGRGAKIAVDTRISAETSAELHAVRGPVDGSLVVGELTDNSRQVGRNGPDLPVETATEKQAACSDRPDISNSQASSVPADTAGEAWEEDGASPAANPDDIDLTIPDFLRRTEGGYPKREAVEV